MAAVAVEHCKERGLLDAWGQLLVRSAPWLLEVEHNRDPVFVVVPAGSIVCVCCVGLHKAVVFVGYLAPLKSMNDLPERSNSILMQSRSLYAQRSNTLKDGVLRRIEHSSLGVDEVD